MAALCFERSGPSVQSSPLQPFAGSSGICQPSKRPVVHSLKMDIRLHCYLDDWLILADSNAKCAEHTPLVFWQILSLSGLFPIWEGTISFQLNPSSSRGWHLACVDKPYLSLSSFRARPSATSWQLSSLAGMMEFLSSLVPIGCIVKCPLQRQFQQHWSPSNQFLDRRVSLGLWFLSSISSWLDTQFLVLVVPVLDPLLHSFLYTDATRGIMCVCVLGGGGGMQRRSKSLAFGWRKSMWHFSWLKLEAEFHSLLAFLPALSGKAARLFNNNTVAFYASKGGACSFSLSLSTVEMLWWCQSHGIAPFSQTFSQQVEHRGQHFESSSQCSSHGMGYVQSGILPVWDLWFILMVDLLLPSSATGS